MSVNYVHLVKPQPGEPLSNVIRKQTNHLPAGSLVRVDLSAIPATDYTGADWLRPELRWQIESENPDDLQEWQKRLAGGGCNE